MQIESRLARLSVKLPLIISTLVAICVVVLSYLGYSSSRQAIVTEASARLQAVGESQARALETLLSTIDRNLHLVAEAPHTAAALSTFTREFSRVEDATGRLQDAYIVTNPHPAGQKEKLDAAATGTGYDGAHAKYHPYFRHLQQEMGYYDVFLFDLDGNLVYSVFKEPDYATNFMNGQYKDTDLGVVFRHAMETAANESAVYQDFEPYAPSNGAPAAFIARPVFAEDGTRLGVLAYQMPIDEFSKVTASLTGLGASGDSFIVGADGLMRTNSRFGDGNDILATRIDADAIERGFAGENGIARYLDSWGNEVMAYFMPLSFLGTDWVVIAKENEQELFSELATLARSFVMTGLAIFGAMLMLTYLLSRSISQPMQRLVVAVEQIGLENFETSVAAKERKDEIGDIARAIDAFREKLAAGAEDALEAAFKGAAYDTSGAPTFLTDIGFNITNMNQAATRLMHERAADFRTAVPEFDPDEVLGKNMDAFHGNPGKQRSSLSDIKNLPFKIKIAIGDAYLGLFVDKVLDRKGAHVGYIAEWKDQTYQMANQVVMDGIDAQQCRIEARLDGRIKFANAHFCQVVDKTAEDLVGTDITSLVTPMDETADTWASARSGESAFGLFRIGSGPQARIIDGSLSSVPDQKGRPNGFLILGVDVTVEHETKLATEAERDRLANDQEIVVSNLRDSLKRMADGDLTCTIATEFSPNYEQLRFDFNVAVDNLRNAMCTVIENAGEIGSEANSISTSVGDLSKRTEQQAATLEETAAAVEELTTSVNSTAKGAKDAADIASAARAHAESSGEIVQSAVAAMNEIERSSNEISKIISVIDDIAFQTNLLALNAGVEAARAGESGRGFAVVASEVRALAQRSLEAASEINSLITASGDSVEHGVELVGSTGEALEKIVVSVAEISDLVNNIAVSAAEQSSGISEINAAMNELETTTQRNAAMAEETTAATLALASETKALVSVTSKFDTGKAEASARPSEGARSPGFFDDEQVKHDVKHDVAAIRRPARTQGNLAIDEQFDAGGWEDF